MRDPRERRLAGCANYRGFYVDVPEWPAGRRREEHTRERYARKDAKKSPGPASHSDTATSPIIVNGVPGRPRIPYGEGEVCCRPRSCNILQASARLCRCPIGPAGRMLAHFAQIGSTRLVQAVAAHLVVQRAHADIQPLSRMFAVIVALGQGLLESPAFRPPHTAAASTRPVRRSQKLAGQVAHLDDFGFGRHDQSFDQIAELAHIAGPRMVGDRLQSIAR